jgi:hypothetical protein
LSQRRLSRPPLAKDSRTLQQLKPITRGLLPFECALEGKINAEEYLLLEAQRPDIRRHR